MNKRLFIAKIDEHYCDYLRKYDVKVPYNFDKKNRRPFIGVLFEVNNFLYFAPLTSPKSKHLKMKNTIDFLKLDKGKLGAVNFNNMIPVTTKNVIKINLDVTNLDKAEKQYNQLLKSQLFWLNRNVDMLYKKSKKIYDKYIDGTLNPKIMARCCNFTLLEKECYNYNKEKIKCNI